MTVSETTPRNSTEKIKVFAHVAYGFSAKTWNDKYNNGHLIGINEPFAYGYHRAEELGCSVIYSGDKPENGFQKLIRLGIRYFLKFDLVHAWRNRVGIYDADVVWTHTESQHLAILLLFRMLWHKKNRPKLIAQSVWLFDRWFKFPWYNRWMCTKLLSRADLLTVHSSENLKVARSLFPNVRSEIVLFGIRADEIIAPRIRAINQPIRLISLGNDEDRDWTTLIEAVQDLDGCELRIVSQRISPKLVREIDNIEVVRVNSNIELFELYEWADMLILAIRPNLHASGITVLQEAAIRGVPIICSDVGGLRSYFSEEAVKYVRPQDVAAIRRAVLEIANDNQKRWDLLRCAQARMGATLSSHVYVSKHVELSKELLNVD